MEIFLQILFTVGMIGGIVQCKPADIEEMRSDSIEGIKVIEAAGDENTLQPPNDSFNKYEETIDKEEAGRFIVTQVGTMMCYRAWEFNAAIDFHTCNVCFNNTFNPNTKLSKEDHIGKVESCFNKYLIDSDFKECLPMLRDSTIPNKVYDILTTEPPFDFSYRNFVLCAHGLVFKQESAKCVNDDETVMGSEAFLEKFACLLKNLVAESRRFSEANLKELLGSVPVPVQAENLNSTAEMSRA